MTSSELQARTHGCQHKMGRYLLATDPRVIIMVKIPCTVHSVTGGATSWHAARIHQTSQRRWGSWGTIIRSRTSSLGRRKERHSLQLLPRSCNRTRSRPIRCSCRYRKSNRRRNQHRCRSHPHRLHTGFPPYSTHRCL